MKIVVYGLGIIGASLCMALTRAGHTVYGKNRSRAPVAYALERRMIAGEAQTYAGADAVFLALPPDVTARELDEGKFDEGTVVCDICGVKACLETLVYAKPRVYRYVGLHPMAGKETSGIRSADARLFEGANLVITPCARTDAEALSCVRTLAREMGFGRIVECSAEEHDRKIALTSQLAHIVSNAYAKSEQAQACAGFTGGSFQDMTRIAGVDERMWTQPYRANRENLLGELDGLIARLGEYREALARDDGEVLSALLREGREAAAGFLQKK